MSNFPIRRRTRRPAFARRLNQNQPAGYGDRPRHRRGHDRGKHRVQGPEGRQGRYRRDRGKGDTGATGGKGDTGAQGLKGDTGAAGAKGDPGTPTTVNGKSGSVINLTAADVAAVPQAVIPRFLPDRSTFAPATVAGAGEYSVANAQVIVPAGLVVKGTGWDGAAIIIHEGNDCDTSNSGQVSTKVNGFTVVHALDQALPGGSAASIRGGRQAGNFVLVKAVATTANNPDRHYVGLVGQALDKVGDGGTSAAPKGRVFGMNGYGGVQANSFWENVTSGEHNTEIDPTATVDYHAGLQIVGIIGKRGRSLDAGLAIGAIGPSYAFVSGTAGTRGFGNLIAFTNKNGRSPVEVDSNIMAFDHNATCCAASTSPA